MNASNASMISSRFSTACGFSSLAITGIRRPSSSITWCTGSMSAALRTKDSAIMSTPLRSAQRRSSVSFSLIAGTLTATPGRLIPLLLLTLPPTVTSVITSVSVTSVARRAIRPSSIKIRSPGLTSPHRPLYVVEQRSTVPGTSSMVIAKVAPFAPDAPCRWRTGPAGSSDPAGRPGRRSAGRRSSTPRGHCEGSPRGRRSRRGSCSGGRRPCPRRPVRQDAPARTMQARACRQSWLYARSRP